MTTTAISQPDFRRFYTRIVDDELAMQMVEHTLSSQYLLHAAIDVETHGETKEDALNPWKGELVGIGVTAEIMSEGLRLFYSFYIPIKTNDPNYSGKLWDEREVGDRLQRAFNTEATWVLFNAKFDIEWLELHCGMSFPLGYFRDPMLEMWLANSPGVDSLGLKELTKFFYPAEVPPVDFMTLLGRGKNKKTILDVPLDDVARYCMADTENTLKVAWHTLRLMEQEGEDIIRLYNEVELPLLRLLANMEMRGVQIDENRLNELAIQLHERLENCEMKLRSFANINWNSTAQVAQALTDAGVKLPLKLTASGKQQLTADILQEVQHQHPIVEVLLEYRGLKKIIDTYITAFYKRSDEHFRIHCNFRQTGTRTGRLSCSEPNLQNIPAEEKDKMPPGVAKAYAELRKLFIGQHGMIVVDLSQIEFRMAAHFSKDPVLVKAYINGHDFHAATADAVTGGNRRLAKNINFGYLYGQRAAGLVKLTGMEMHEARKFYAQFEKSFRILASWDMTTKAKARTYGFASTILGRRRYLPKIKSSNWSERSEAERQAVNTVIQGSAADYLKRAMLGIEKDLKDFPVEMVLQVHDELVFDILEPLPEVDLRTVMAIIKFHMENAIELIVPVTAVPKYVENWAEGK